MDTTSIFAKRLSKLREEKGISQQVLADALGVTRQSLSLYEKAERTINTELLVKIASYFNVSADYLLGLSDVSSIDADVQTACIVTGLNEKAVVELFEINEDWKTHIDYYQERGKEDRRKFYQAMDEIICSLSFREILSNCVYLSKVSETVLCDYGVYLEDTKILGKKIKVSDIDLANHVWKKFPKSIALPGEEFDDTPVKECDLSRYNIMRLTEKIIDSFDRRREYLNYDIEKLLEYLQMDKETLSALQKKEANNGKHNETD